MVEEGADVSEFESFTLDDAGGEKEAPKEAPKEEASSSTEAPDSGSETAPPSGSEKAPAEDSKKSKEPAPEPQESESTGGRLQSSLDREPNISPAAKKAALEKGVALKAVKGSGPGGRITVQDIEKYKPAAGKFSHLSIKKLGYSGSRTSLSFHMQIRSVDLVLLTFFFRDSCCSCWRSSRYRRNL